jgi:hypothetical protein
MLQLEFAGTSSDITFDVLSGQDAARMKSDSRTNANTENMFLIVCYETSFDQVRYSLLLHKRPFARDEWRAIVRDAQKLQSQIAASDQSDVIHSLEAQLNNKDRTIINRGQKTASLEV